ncbi:MAG TPA: P27 family phage terminase small subunit [Stellaceae bacterium]|nr:P27 family phage terminase small subunit [Stellaceae bacterium]
MRRGRPPKPEALKRLHGHAGKRRRSKNPAPPTAASPAENVFSAAAAELWAPPGWLPAPAKDIWTREIETARRQARLQESQIPLFASYCAALSRLEHYTAQLEAEGAVYTTPSGYRRLAPEVSLRDKASAEVRALAVELLLSPRSWTTSTAIFTGKQLELYLNRPRAIAPAATPAEEPAEASSGSLGGYISRRPMVH